MIRIAICDDDSRVTKELSKMATSLLSSHKLPCCIDCFLSGIELIACKQQYDLLFLDIFMNSLNGIEVARLLRDQGALSTKIVFVSSHSGYRMNALNLRAFGYIDKPIKQDELAVCLQDFLSYKRAEQLPNRDIAECNTPFAFETSQGKMTLLSEQIYYFEKDGKKTQIVYMSDTKDQQSNGEHVVTSLLLKDLREYYMRAGFETPHKSFLVNMMHINRIKGFWIYMNNELSIPLAQKRAKEFKQKYASYLAEYYRQI